MPSVDYFWPVLLRQWRRFTGRPTFDSPANLSLYHRCLCILLAAIFLIGPETFQSLAQADVQYAELSTFTWVDGGTVTTYTYDANGSLETKHTVKNGSTTTEKLRYLYNLQGRLTEIQDIQTNPAGDTLATYAYNPQGIRVSQTADGTTTTYLIDPDNPTGYAQVLEEWTGGPVPAVTYTIGDDLIAQTDGSGATEYLLYDGHGSTRQLADDSTPVVVTDSYSYDAYGTMLGGNPAAGSSPGTRLLYAGEHFDEHAQHYYNRARWYNPQTGRFNRTDPWSGSPQDPQSLHKYLYCHANPVNAVDPSGLYSLGEMLCVSMIVATLTTFAAGALHFVTGHTLAESLNYAAAWFWIAFFTTAAVYCGIWALHSVWTWFFGGTAGTFGNLQYGEDFGIASYRILRTYVEGTQLPVHHIIPQRFAGLLGVSPRDMLSVVLTGEEHAVFTQLWRPAIPYGTLPTSVTLEQLWIHAQTIYADYPALLEAARIELLHAGAAI